jgi:glutaconate CoA-transferase, subunit B
MKQLGGRTELLKRFTPMEMMVVEASRLIKDNTTVFVGVGLSLLPSQLAQRTRTPGITQVFESGIIGASSLGRAPWGVDDTALQVNATAFCDLMSALGWMAMNNKFDLCFLGAAQVDKYGNVNSTVIGDYARPRSRLPGSGGAHDVAAGGQRYVVLVRHDKLHLVERLDYRTSPGFITGGSSREELGLPGGGPSAIVTDLCSLTPDPATKEFILTRVHPYSSVEDIRNNTGWDLKVSDHAEESLPPTEEELNVLRNELDVEGEFTGWKKPVLETTTSRHMPIGHH